MRIICMRFLKKLLIAVYIFLGVFAVACLILWCITGDEPEALITGIFAAAGIESIVGAFLKKFDSAAPTDTDGSTDTNIDNRRE